eukprot:986973-Alexandrium_andersonii.AAC.1
MAHFKPTLACPASDPLIQNLLPGWRDTQAAGLACPRGAVELIVVAELPDVPLAREYLAYQN